MSDERPKVKGHKKVITKASAIARAHGYAIAVHGSLRRDIDLIAVPWVQQPATPGALIEALCEALNVYPRTRYEQPTLRPHGRLAWSLQAGWLVPAYIDISVIPPTPVARDDGGET